MVGLYTPGFNIEIKCSRRVRELIRSAIEIVFV